MKRQSSVGIGNQVQKACEEGQIYQYNWPGIHTQQWSHTGMASALTFLAFSAHKQRHPCMLAVVVPLVPSAVQFSVFPFAGASHDQHRHVTCHTLLCNQSVLIAMIQIRPTHTMLTHQSNVHREEEIRHTKKPMAIAIATDTAKLYAPIHANFHLCRLIASDIAMIGPLHNQFSWCCCCQGHLKATSRDHQLLQK